MPGCQEIAERFLQMEDTLAFERGNAEIFCERSARRGWNLNARVAKSSFLDRFPLR